MARIRRLTGGRAWAARLSGLLVLAAIVALIVAVMPVGAHNDIPPSSGAGVTPSLVSLGGEGGDCEAVQSTGDFELRIENPQPGASVSANHGGGVTVTFTIIDVYNLEKEGWRGEAFRWSLDAAGTDLIVKGGADSAHYDFVDALPHGLGHTVNGDFDSHATARNKKRLHSVSHATVCYDLTASIFGTVWHDNDQDGVQDNTDPQNIDPDEPIELGLEGWTVRVYDSSGTEVASTDPDGTAADGSYSFPGLPIGEDYTVCQEDPNGGMWSQNAGTVTSNVCGINDLAGLPDEEPAGHVFEPLQGDATADFGDFITEQGGCGSTFGSGEHTVTLPANPLLCNKPSGEWVVETYFRANGEEVHDFHPLFGFGGTKADVTEEHLFSLDGIKTQNGETLMYDDGAGGAEALLCKVDPRLPNGDLDPAKVGSVALKQTGGPNSGPHTTCIIESTKGSNDTIFFLLYSRIDGRRWF